MAVAISQYNSDYNGTYLVGTATADSDATEVFPLVPPATKYAISVSRPTSGGAACTLQGSLDGLTWVTLATISIVAGTTDFEFAVDKPCNFVKIVFTSVDSATATFCVLATRG